MRHVRYVAAIVFVLNINYGDVLVNLAAAVAYPEEQVGQRHVAHCLLEWVKHWQAYHHHKGECQ